MQHKLSAENIINHMTSESGPTCDFQILVEESVPSTNDYLINLMSKSEQQLPKTAVIAQMQTAGKGRHGRNWVSVPGNVLLSVYWPFQCGLDQLYGLSLVVGIAIARVLKRMGLHEVQLKWPNDIYWHGRKMGGILIETKQRSANIIDTVIGIGLNVVEMQDFKEQIDQKFVSLEEALKGKVERDKLIAQLLLELDVVLQIFITKGFGEFVEEWRNLDAKIKSLSTIDEKDFMSKIIHAEKIKKDHEGSSVH